MCAPAMAVIGGIVSGVGSLVSGMQQAQALEQQAAWQQRQAVIEEQRGKYESERERDRARRLISRQRAGFLSAGVSLEGTPEDIIADTTAETELDVQAIRYGAQIRADNHRAQAAMTSASASQARTGAIFGAISPIIGGFTQATRMRGAFG